ncbi:MAG: hypothetical protein H6R18_2003 [Proteobacteria bacterium]|nr:hypothetical protein [Pseudomonadota bacterium]
MMRRRIIIAVLLVATLIAAWFAPPDSEKGVVAPSIRPVSSSALPDPARNSSETTAAPVEVLTIKPRNGEEEDSVLFSPTQWEKPQEVEKVEPPPEPQAPPLPFKLLGRYIENGVTGFFLSHNDQNLVVREGDMIADLYKFEGEKEGGLHFLYLPLKKQQTLEIGALK